MQTSPYAKSNLTQSPLSLTVDDYIVQPSDNLKAIPIKRALWAVAEVK